MIRTNGHSGLTRIGLLSDSHGRAGTTERAVRLLLQQGVDLIVHLGDIGSVEVIDALVDRLDERGELDPPVRAVLGNCDWDEEGLSRYAESLGVRMDHPVGRLEVDDRTVVFQHGHQDAAMEQALAGGTDYLCHGHTHRPRDERIDGCRVINPGALFRAAEYTVAVLDVSADALTFHTVPEE